jgi:hypothetical protein
MQTLLAGGREGFAAGSFVSATGTFFARLLDLAEPSPAVKAITGFSIGPSLRAVQVASTAGWSEGDMVVVRGVTDEVWFNSTFQIGPGLTADTIPLLILALPGVTPQPPTGPIPVDITGVTIINLSVAGPDTDFAAGAGGSADLALSGLSVSGGRFTCDNPLIFTGLDALTPVDAAIFFQTDPVNAVFYFTDGRQLVRVAVAPASTADATLQVDPLYAPIEVGTILSFSNGTNAALTADAAMGARTLAVTYVGGIPGVNDTAEAPIFGMSLPGVSGDLVDQVEFSIDPDTALFGL